MDSVNSLSSARSDMRRDERFYFPDGDVTILVSQTLFRVHKHVIARDGSTFEDMFSLSSDLALATRRAEFVQDGQDDDHPVVMQGDTEDEFRDLLWVMYALPQEIAQAMSPGTEAAVIRLANVGRMANKYHFTSTESWALKSLFAFFQTDLPNAISLSTTSLVKVTEVAVLCGSGAKASLLMQNVGLIDVLRTKWKGLIRNRKDLGLAISVTERLGIRDLCGLAYHSMLIQGREAWEKEASLTREHRIRLLSGFHNVTQFCDALPSSPPPFIHHPNCVDGPELCNKAWKAFWGSMMSLDPDVGVGAIAIKHEKLDVMGRLMMAVSIMQTLEEGALHTTGRHPFEDCDECHKVALDATRRFFRQTQQELMDFFPEVV